MRIIYIVGLVQVVVANIDKAPGAPVMVAYVFDRIVDERVYRGINLGVGVGSYHINVPEQLCRGVKKPLLKQIAYALNDAVGIHKRGIVRVGIDVGFFDGSHIN